MIHIFYISILLCLQAILAANEAYILGIGYNPRYTTLKTNVVAIVCVKVILPKITGTDKINLVSHNPLVK